MTTTRASQSFLFRVAALLLLACACTTDPDPSFEQAAQAGGLSGAGAVGGTDAMAGSAAIGGAGSAAQISGAGGVASNMSNGGLGGAAAAPSTGGTGGTSGMPGTGGAASTAGMNPMSSTGGMTGPAVETVPTLYWLDINSNRVMRSENFAEGVAIVARTGTAPDGIAVDVEGGKIYWTNMGSLLGTGGGSLQRANLDGTDVETIVASGIARTPKQMQLDLVNRHVYFCDREGAKVWRAGMDGSDPEAIVSEHGFQELVGVALDVPAGKFYFSDRIGKKILRANLEMPVGQTGTDRTDIEEMLVLAGSAMPIDLDIDHHNAKLYWTDRQLGTVHRADLEIPAGQTAANRTDNETLVTDLVDTIGISLDVANDKMYFSELGGEVSASALDGSALMKDILSSGSATGVAIAHVPKP